MSKLPKPAAPPRAPELPEGAILRDDPETHRRRLAFEGGALELALGAAASVRPKTMLEAMLVDQLAAAHELAMRLAGRAMTHERNAEHDGFGVPKRQFHAIEAARAVNATARMMETYQRGLLTLERIRSGGKQTVVVQHVYVGEGGRAVVAGRVRGGAKRK